MSQYYTPDELAALIKVPKSTIYYWVCRGKIPYIKFEKHLRFYLPEIIQHFRAKHASEAGCIDWEKYIDMDPRSLTTKVDESAGLQD